ncbi:MAG TPA: hypothetical protein VEK57_23075 [Thermoanaerobaculia bacterium]|nr:hypothetical protein [Thermoanaerobaculia bacterium]
MAIQISEAPAAGLRLVLETLSLPDQPFQSQPAVPGAVRAPAGPVAAAAPLDPVRKPYPVFTATIRRLFGGGGLKSAQLTAWQYVIQAGETARSVAEVAVADFTGEPEEGLVYASEQPPSYGDALIAAIEDAKTRPEVTVRDYELRVLRVPDLDVLAIWLHGENEELLRLVRGKRATLAAPGWVGEARLLEALNPLAEIRQTANDR